MRVPSCLTAVAAVLIVAGCSANRAAVLPAERFANAPEADSKTVSATVRLTIPKSSGEVASFVDSATKGVSIAVYHHGHHAKPVVRAAKNVAAGSPDCKRAKHGRVCSLVVNLDQPGRFDFVLRTYDKGPMHGRIPSDAKELGAGVATRNVASNGKNLVRAVIGGVVAKLLFELNTTGTPAIDPLDEAAQVQALDVDGATIVTGSFADAKGGTVTVSMHADAQAGTTIVFEPSTFTKPQPDGIRMEYHPYDLTSTQAANGFASILSATASNGATPANVTFTAAQPAIVETGLPTAHSWPQGITAGPDGEIWFAEDCNAKIGKISTNMLPTSVVEYPTPTSGSRPGGIARGPDGALWFTEFTANKVGRVTTAGVVTEFSIPTSGTIPYGIAAGPDGNLWISEYAGNAIGKVTTSGAVTSYAIPVSTSRPTGIALGSDGAMWFTECAQNKIGRVTTGGLFVAYSVPTAGSSPASIALGSDGALWFTEISANKIGRLTTSGAFSEFAVPTASSEPQYIALGPDGAVWFTELMPGKIGRIGANGTAITEYALPSSTSEPVGITTGPDGAVYFTEFGGNSIGRLR
jgi:virginiamycin B lyase